MVVWPCSNFEAPYLGLVLRSRVSLARFPLNRFFVLLSSSQSDTLDYSVRAYFNTWLNIGFQSMSPFQYFLHLTDVFLLVFHTSYDHLSPSHVRK